MATTPKHAPREVTGGYHAYFRGKFYEFRFPSMGAAEADAELFRLRGIHVHLYYEDECGKHFYTPEWYGEVA